jgi:hypothetical protein
MEWSKLVELNQLYNNNEIDKAHQFVLDNFDELDGRDVDLIITQSVLNDDNVRQHYEYFGKLIDKIKSMPVFDNVDYRTLVRWEYLKALYDEQVVSK